MTPYTIGIKVAQQRNVPGHAKQAYAAGFAEALEKRGIDERTVLFINGGLLAGLLAGELGVSMANRKFKTQAARTDLPRIPASEITDLPILKTHKDIRKHMGRVPLSLRLTDLDPKKAPWAFYLDERQTKGRPAYVLPSDKPLKHVYLHERGHAAQDKDPNSVKRRPITSAMLGVLLGGKHTPMYRHEVDAWDRAGIPEDDALRQAALRTYSRVFDPGRFALAGALAGFGLSKITR
jgi:hypothetical protein